MTTSAAALRFDANTGSGRGAPLRLGIGASADAIEAARRRGVMLPDAYYGLRSAQARAMGFSVAGLAGLSQLEAVKDSLDAAFEAGESFDAWRKRVLRGEVPLSLPKYRLETIFRTNMQTVYMAGRGAQAAQHADTHPYLLYSAVMDSRTRPAHADMHGTILPIHDAWWNTHRPPNGYNCRCTVIALTAKEAQRRGVSHLAPNAAPDPGFDNDPWAEPMAGVKAGLDKFAAHHAGPLGKAAEQVAIEAEAMLPKVKTLADALAHGKTTTRELLGKLAIEHGDAFDAGKLSVVGEFSALLRERIRRVHGEFVPAKVAHKKGKAAAAKTVAAAGERYPASWVAATNDAGDLTVMGSDARAFAFTMPKMPHYPDALSRKVRFAGGGTFIGKAGEGYIRTEPGNLRVAVHEFGHRIQSVLPALDRIFQDYHATRTAGESLVKLKTLQPNRAYKSDEVTLPDNWLNPYFGKMYGERGALEMLTMTFEHVLGGSPEALLDLYKRDRELFELAVGLLTGWAP